MALISKFYPPSCSFEDYDTETNSFFNSSGQKLRDPEEYETDCEGYTPFGDE
jgi:hypothetical protein